jgi:predicted permease
MNILRRISVALRSLIMKKDVEAELDDELRFHLEMETRENIKRGLDPKEARNAALSSFGGIEKTKEYCRDARGVRFIESFLQDSRYALRFLWKHPVFTAVTVLTLALGIGATTAVFSVVNGVVLKPLPFKEPHHLVSVWMRAPGLGIDWVSQCAAAYFTFRDENRVFEDVGLWKNLRVTVTGLDEAEQVQGLLVTEGLLPTLGVSPVLGRTFTVEDDSAGSPPVIVLGFGYWQSRFGGDRDVIGRMLTVDGRPAEIVGVMPQGFRFMYWTPDLFFPAQFDRATIDFGNFSYRIVARLRQNVSLEDAHADVQRMIPIVVERFPGGMTQSDVASAGLAPRIHLLKSEIVGSTETVLWILLGSVGFLLLIACTNVANLLLVRADERRLELALRAALGAPRGRMIQSALVESLVLGLLGGAMGLFLANVGIGLVTRLGSETLPRLHAVSMDAHVLAFALGISVGAGFLFGLFPIFRQVRTDHTSALKEGVWGQGLGGEGNFVRNLLAVSQLAIALLLLIGSGLMLRSLLSLERVDPGFRHPESVLTMRLSTPGSGYFGSEEDLRIHEEILHLLESLPGVVSASASTSITMDRYDTSNSMQVEGFPTEEGQLAPIRRLKWVAGDYFRTMENPLLAGRTITWSDIHSRAPVVVVTEDLALEYWNSPGEALGKRIREDDEDTSWREIVGVVGRVHDDGLSQPSVTVIYMPMATEDFWGNDLLSWRQMGYVIRTTRPTPESLVPEVRNVVQSVNEDIPLFRVQTLEEILDASTAQTSFVVVMLGVSAFVALALSVIGVYGVISYLVSRRTQEIAIRVAMGAARRDIHVVILKQGLMLTILGVGLGIVCALGLTRLLTSLLYEVKPVDGLTYGIAVASLAAAALLACFIPAKRASSLEPVEALRLE